MALDERKVPAAVPPRKVIPGRNRSQTIIRNTDSREVLMGMGFPKNRAYVTLCVCVCVCVCVRACVRVRAHVVIFDIVYIYSTNMDMSVYVYVLYYYTYYVYSICTWIPIVVYWFAPLCGCKLD